MSEQIIKEYGGCEITLTFADKGETDMMERVMWLLMNHYEERIAKEIELEQMQQKKVS